MSREEFERIVAFKVADGTSTSTPDCTATGVETEVMVVCTYSQHPTLHMAIGAPPVGFRMRLLVNREGIRQINDALVGDFLAVHNPLVRWVSEFHAEDTDLVDSFNEWGSVARAELAGSTIARYADEYAAYLKANGCVWDAPCVP